MGRYEDLLEQAEAGDTDAFTALREEFSGSALRSQAEQGNEWKAKYESALPEIRKTRLAELVSKLPEDLRDSGVSLADFGDFDPGALTLEQVLDRATVKSEALQQARQTAAEAAGFDSVEDYEGALQAVKQAQDEKRQGMETFGGAAASSGGVPPGSEEKSSFESGKEAFETAKSEGRSDDWAQARAVDAILTRKAEEAGVE